MTRISRPHRAHAPSVTSARRATALRELAFALACLVAAPVMLHAQQNDLRLNTVYVCKGEKLVVTSCSRFSGSCMVALPGHHLANGQLATIAVPRSNLEQRLPQCFMRGAPKPGEMSPGLSSMDPSTPQYPVQMPTGNPYGEQPSIIPKLFTVQGLFALLVVIWLGRKIYKRVVYSRYSIVRRSNKQAIEMFGTGDRAAREKAITEAFDSSDYTFRLHGENRNKPYMMRFVLLRNIKTLKRQDLESLRFAYVGYNRGLVSEEKFYTYRITAIYEDGKTDPSEIEYIGLLAFWHKRKTRGEIERARGAVQGFARENCTENLHQQTLAEIQALAMKYPQDEFYADMLRRFLEGSRWLGVGDIRKSAFAEPEVPTPYSQQLGMLDGTNVMLRYSGDGSILTIAPPGSGKTTCNVVPNLLRWPGAAVLLDVKGEIYDLTSRHRSTIGPVIKFSPLDPEKSQCYNPLAFVRRESFYVWEDASNAANMMLVPGQGGDKNKFFEDSARDILTAIIADLAFWNRPEDRPMSKVLSILNRNGWDEFLDRLRKNPDVNAMQDLGVSLAKEHPETLSNILSFARSSMNSWKGERIAYVTKRSDWHPNDLRNGKHPTIYICINSEDIETYASLLRVFVAQHINVLMSQKVSTPGQEPILFCLDEFPRLGGMKPIEKALETGRGYGLRMWLFAQNFGQIENAYANAKGLMENCLVRTFMNPTVASAALIAEEIGKEGVAEGADKQSTVSAQELAGPVFKNLQIVVGQSSKPAKVRKLPYYKDPELNARVGSLDDRGVAAPGGVAARV
jgi:type IV secretion system protein VirD4